MAHSIRTYYAFFLFLGIWLSLITYQSCSSTSSTKHIKSNAEYVGSKQCQSCHETAYDKWSESHHYFSMLPADENSVIGDFNNVTVKLNGIESRFYVKNGNYYIHTQGENGKAGDYRIKYTFGYHPLQQYLIEMENGYVQATRLAWDALESKWFHLQPDMVISPEEWLHWTNRSMNWNSMCSECHSTATRKNFNDSSDFYNTQWKEVNAACESCHGPGSLHVENVEKSEQDSIYQYLAQHSGISSTLQVEACAPCHARRSTVSDEFDPGNDFFDHYMPEVLRYELYHEDGQIKDEVFVYGSFVQSKMYHNGVKCTDCHDPHSLELKFQGNDLCLQCHEPSYDLESHTFHKAETEGSECVNCHMSGKTYMVNDYRRDHSFRIPRPDQSVRYETPNACTQCHQDQTDQWAAQAVENWYGPDRNLNYTDYLLAVYHGEATANEIVKILDNDSVPDIAKATLINYISGSRETELIQVMNQTLLHPNPMIRIESVKYFTSFPPVDRIRFIMSSTQDSSRAVRVVAAGVLSDIPLRNISPQFKESFQKAIYEYEQYLSYNADFKTGQLMLGQYYERQGDLTTAERSLMKALEIDSLFNPARLNLSLLYNQQGRNIEALDLYKTVIAMEPDYAPAYYSAGLLLVEMNKISEALEYLRTAIEKDGSNPRVYYNYGLLLQRQGNYSEAESVFLRGLDVSESVDIRHALAILYLQNEAYVKASYQIDQLLTMFPENPQYQQWKKELDQRLTQ